MKLVDLHTHSTASDGSYAPGELVRYAKEKGLGAIALTDHDTAEGLPEAVRAGAEAGIEVVPGVELTTVVEGCDVHIVGLCLDPAQPDLARALGEMGESRRRRNEKILAGLARAGVRIGPGDFRDLGDRAITKGHIAAVLIRGGYASDLKDAIARYMARGTPGYVLRETPTPEECVRVIHRAGGLAFVAHMNQIDRRNPLRSIEICRRVIRAGADGLETKYCEFDSFWEKTAEGVARELGLLRSGGSDFHGAIKRGLDLGVGYGSLAVPYAFWEAIREAKAGAAAEGPSHRLLAPAARRGFEKKKELWIEKGDYHEKTVLVCAGGRADARPGGLRPERPVLPAGRPGRPLGP